MPAWKTLAFIILGAFVLGSSWTFLSARRSSNTIAGYSASFEIRSLIPDNSRDYWQLSRGRLFVSFKKPIVGIRHELLEQDRQRIFIWRQNPAFVAALDPIARVYWTPTDKTKIAPYEGVSSDTPGVKREYVGEERIEGRSVLHYRLTNEKDGGDVRDYWEDAKLHVCVREVQPGRKEYRMFDIREGTQSAYLFDVPSDYDAVPTRPDGSNPLPQL